MKKKILYYYDNFRYAADFNDQEEMSPAETTSEDKPDDSKEDYDALVDKVFQLREIIRGLESEGEEKAKVLDRRTSEIDELRTALMDALMKQESNCLIYF